MRRIVGAVAGLMVVAIAATAAQRRAPKLHHGHGADALLGNVLVTIIVAYAVVAVVVTVLALANMRRRPSESRGRSRGGLLGSLLLILIVLLVVRLLHRPLQRIAVPRVAATSTPPTTDVSDVARPTGGASPWATWLGLLLGVGVIVAVIVANARDRARRSPFAAHEPDRRLAVSESIDELLAQLDAEPDPRTAVLLADHGMELIFARHGSPRLPTETAHEFLGRVQHELSISSSAASLLTQLYTSAHFGTATLDADARLTAIAAVRAVRDELRVPEAASA